MITDTQGDLQPRQRQENERGYGPTVGLTLPSRSPS